MTDDFDELVSAYLDGQTTTDESARVESDPQLLAQVDALRSVLGRLASEPVAVDPEVQRRHLSSALGAFDDLMAGLDHRPTDGTGASAGVIDLRPGQGQPYDRRQEQPYDRGRQLAPALRPQRQPTGRRGRRRPVRAMPSWLAAAAVAVVVAGGLAWLATRQSTQSGNTSAAYGGGARTTASQGAKAADAAGQSAESGQLAGGAAQASTAAAVAPVPSTAGPATNGSPRLQQPDDSPITSGAPGPATGGVTTGRSTASTNGPATTFPSSTTTAVRAPVTFTQLPTQQELNNRILPGPLGQPAQSACGPRVQGPANTTLTGFAPVTVAGRSGEALVYSPVGGGSSHVELVDASCKPFS